MIFIRVLLPAPFSPTMAKISPFSTENEMLSFARFPGNILEMLRTSSAFMASLPYNGEKGRRCTLLAPESSCHGLTTHHDKKVGTVPAVTALGSTGLRCYCSRRQTGPLATRRHGGCGSYG